MPRLLRLLASPLAVSALVLLGACVTEPEPLPPEDENDAAYGPCTDAWSRILCLEIEDVCIDDGGNGAPALNFACGASCETESDCPQAPSSGDAVVVCDAQDTCILSCGDNILCPTGMSCISNVCLNPTP